MNEADSSFEHFCRVCATQSNRVENLFETNHDEICLADMLMYCLKRSVSRTDGLPESICLKCKTNLIFTYEFHSLCKASEQLFLKRLSLKCQSNDEFGTIPSSEVIHSTNEISISHIKIEDDYESPVAILQESSTVDDCLEFDVQTNMLASELVCVEENFDVNNIEVEDEGGISEHSQPVNRLRQRRNPTKPKSAQATVRRTRSKANEENKEFQCFECKKGFYSLNDLRHHMNEHNKSQKPFECRTCFMRFIHLNSLVRHKLKHNKNIYECEYCSQSFNTLTGVKQHVQDQHKDHHDAYECGQCSEKFAMNFLLILHQEWHKKAKPIHCNTCNAVFFNERKLKAHIRDNHANHLCAECGKSFRTIHSLASHQMLHTEEKPFACDLCPSRFKWKAALRTHILVHTGQKQHVCDICGSSFTTKGSMKKHKRIHTGDRRYHCETCSMRFYSNDHLKRHKRTHTGERPYICTYCPRSFSQSNDLTKHLRSHVGQNLYRCDDCGESFRLQTELRKHSYTHYNKEDNPEAFKTEQPQ